MERCYVHIHSYNTVLVLTPN